MDNQHKLIKGYRDLTEGEIASMNAVKQHAEDTQAIVEMVRDLPGVDQRWASIAQTHLQQGYMALVRAIAKPETF